MQSFIKRFVFLTLMITIVIFAGDLEDGDNAYRSQDYQSAHTYYLKVAEQGNAEAQYKLAKILYYNLGVDDNKKEAIQWYEKAAFQGYIDAQVSLGKIYHEGKGFFTLANNDQAMNLFKKAATNGSSEAECMIGIMYRDGDGVADNLQEAMKWFKISAAKNNACAQFNLGYMFSSGNDNVPINHRLAMDWYLKAAKQGEPSSLNNIGIMFARGKGVMQDYSIAHALFNLAAASGYKYNNDADDEEEILEDDDKSREYVNMRIADAQVNEAISYARNPDKLWKVIDEVRNVSFTNVK